MQYIKGLIKFFASTLILFLLLEVTARFYYFGLDVFDYTKINSFSGMGVSGVLKASPSRRALR